MKKHNHKKNKQRNSKLSFLRLIIISLTLILFSGYSSLAWQTEYKFKKGQVLEYEYTIRVPSLDYNYSDFTSIIYHFEILEVQNNVAKIHMKFGNYNQYEIDGSSEKKVRNYKINSTVFFPSIAPYFDSNEEIYFEINSKGEIISINGVDKLKENVLKKIKNHQPDYKLNIPYIYIQKRFSEDYYRAIIQDIFPLRMSIEKKLKFFSGSKKKEITLHFKPKIADPINNTPLLISIPTTKTDSLNKILTKNPNIFIENNENGFCITRKSWSIDWNRHTRLNFWYCVIKDNNKKYWHSRLFDNIVDLDILAEISIKQLSLTNVISQKGIIEGVILNGIGKKTTFLQPPSHIHREVETTFIKTDSIKRTWEVDLTKGSNFINIYLSDSEDLNYKRSKYEKFKLFIRPGDTISFKVDLKNFPDWSINGDLKKENNLLNSLSKKSHRYSNEEIFKEFNIIYNSENKYFVRNLRYSFIPTHAKNKKMFEEKKHELNKEFIEKYELDWLYMDLKLKLKKFMIKDEFPSYNNPFLHRDSVLLFSSYLNNYKGKFSEAYLDFLTSYSRVIYLLTFSSKERGFHQYFNYQTVQSFFKEWDEYFLLARFGVYPYLYTNDGPEFFNLQKNYNEFLYQYPGTEYAKYFQEINSKNEPFHIGKPVPSFILNKIKDNLDPNSLKDNYFIIIDDGKDNRIPNINDYKKSSEHFHKYILVNTDSFDRSKKEILNHYRKLKNYTFIQIDYTFYENCRIAKNSIMFIDKNNIIIDYARLYFNYDYYLTWPKEQPQGSKAFNSTMIWIYLNSLLVLSTIIILIIRRKAKKKVARQALKTKIANLEMDAVRSRMNPHFLFNALSSIQNLINTNQVDKANTYLVKFAKLIRRVLEQSTQKRIELNEEIETLKYYLELESLRQNFKYDIKTDPELDLDIIEIPPLLLQPHVENALIHGIAGMKGKGEITIEFTQSENNLIAIVQDNGIGIKETQNKKESNGLGQGWKITKERIEILNKSYEGRILAEILDKQDESGTFVKFTIPME